MIFYVEHYLTFISFVPKVLTPMMVTQMMNMAHFLLFMTDIMMTFQIWILDHDLDDDPLTQLMTHDMK